MNERVCIPSSEGSITIDPEWTINDLLACAPESAHVLNAFGVDTCCGGGATIAAAAAEAGITAAELTGAITAAVRHRSSTPR